MKHFSSIHEAFNKTDLTTVLLSKQDGEWKSISTEEFKSRVLSMARGLRRLGVKKGDRIAIYSKSRVEWVLSDMAIFAVGGVVVPIYETTVPEQVAYILEHSESKMLITENQEMVDRIEPHICHLPIDEIFAMDGAKSRTMNVCRLSMLENWGDNDQDQGIPDYSVTRDDLATLIYTSGTTATPKGVMLTHGNILSNCESIDGFFPIDSSDVFYSFLPLAHVLQRVAGGIYVILKGANIAFADDIKKVVDDLAEVQPTFFCGVPRVYEKMYQRIMDKKNASSRFRRMLFDWAVKIGKVRVHYELNQQKMPLRLRIKHFFASKLVHKKVQARFGGNIRFMVSGGAALSADIILFFHAIGMPIFEGYGLTETSPVLAANKADACRLGSVGKSVANVEIKIIPDPEFNEDNINGFVRGEICAKGPNVMQGYFKDESETSKVFEDGWFLTGDIGYLDHNDYLYITDRKKEMIITAGGKNIPPAVIEKSFKRYPFIEHVVVVGNGKPYLTALIVPNPEHDDDINLVEEIGTAVRNVNRRLARYQTIKKFHIVKFPFSVETGELTPTLKLKRRVIEKKFAKIIEEMYLK